MALATSKETAKTLEFDGLTSISTGGANLLGADPKP